MSVVQVACTKVPKGSTVGRRVIRYDLPFPWARSRLHQNYKKTQRFLSAVRRLAGFEVLGRSYQVGYLERMTEVVSGS
jgi:hypothetical protein